MQPCSATTGGIRMYSMTMSGTCATHVLTKANPKAVWSRRLRCMQVSLCWWSANCCVQACKQTQRDTQGTKRAKCAHVGDTNNTSVHLSCCRACSCAFREEVPRDVCRYSERFGDSTRFTYSSAFQLEGQLEFLIVLLGPRRTFLTCASGVADGGPHDSAEDCCSTGAIHRPRDVPVALTLTFPS